MREMVNAAVTNWKRSGAGVTAAVLNENAVAFTPGISSRDGATSTFTHGGLKNTERQSVTSSISATRQHDAFGNVISSTGTWQTAFGYAGNFGYQQTDDNLQLLGHRYYDSETGQFISRDPIKDGRNWYGYGGGGGNPLTSADPSGLLSIDSLRANWANYLQLLKEGTIGFLDDLLAAVNKLLAGTGITLTRHGLQRFIERLGDLSDFLDIIIHGTAWQEADGSVVFERGKPGGYTMDDGKGNGNMVTRDNAEVVVSKDGTVITVKPGRNNGTNPPKGRKRGIKQDLLNGLGWSLDAIKELGKQWSNL